MKSSTIQKACKGSSVDNFVEDWMSFRSCPFFRDSAKVNDKVAVEIETNRKSIKIDPYAYPIKEMAGNPQKLSTVGHIPRNFEGTFTIF